MNSSATLTGCDDIIKRLREALKAGPTGGDWTVNGRFNEWIISSDHSLAAALNGGRQFVAACFRASKKDTPAYAAMFRANAEYIAACSPNNIRALLDRLDAAERENERLRESIGMAYGYLWCVNNEPGTPFQYPPERAAYEARKLLRETMTSEQRGTYINRAVALVRGKRPMPLPSTAIDAARAAEKGKE